MMKKKETKNKRSIIYRVIFNWVTPVILLVFLVAYNGAYLSEHNDENPSHWSSQQDGVCCCECEETLNDVVVYINTTSIEYKYYCHVYNMPDDNDIEGHYADIRFVDTQKYEHENYIGMTSLPSKTIELSECINHNTRYTIKKRGGHYNFDVQHKPLFRKKIKEIMNTSKTKDYDTITYSILCVSHPKDINTRTKLQVYDEGFKENRYIHIQYPIVHTECEIVAEYYPDDVVILTEFEYREYIYDSFRGKIMYIHDGETMASYINSMLIKTVKKELQIF